MPYDPQRARHRPEPADDQPAPVDAILDAPPAADEVDLPEGMDVEVTPGGELIVHTVDADVEITAEGDDVVVRTDDATVEVRPEADEVMVSAADEEIFVDTTPRSGADAEAILESEMAAAGRGRRALLLLVALVAAVVAALVAAGLRRRRD
jgi:hypothetical protein